MSCWARSPERVRRIISPGPCPSVDGHERENVPRSSRISPADLPLSGDGCALSSATSLRRSIATSFATCTHRLPRSRLTHRSFRWTDPRGQAMFTARHDQPPCELRRGPVTDTNFFAPVGALSMPNSAEWIETTAVPAVLGVPTTEPRKAAARGRIKTSRKIGKHQIHGEIDREITQLL